MPLRYATRLMLFIYGAAAITPYAYDAAVTARAYVFATRCYFATPCFSRAMPYYDIATLEARCLICRAPRSAKR